jgi:pentatricopeptide repeat protein
VNRYWSKFRCAALHSLVCLIALLYCRYNIVLNAIAKSGGKGAAEEAEKLLERMHELHGRGDPDVKPNVVSYGAVIDCFSKCGDPDAASRADNLLASMIKLHQSDLIRHADLLPNTYVFNCWYVCAADLSLPSLVPSLTHASHF